ncbi:MAG: tRNA/rRNA methyltransferase SpoU [Parcubacteria group bacterium Gr01-1014_107]|nr:MAG: tRNA/rRNA methyltransferase SpoU [Parcubacteria group bacterium Gr01-1014_107]
MDKDKEDKGKYGQFEFKTLSFNPNKPRNRADYLKWLSDEGVKKYLDKRRLNYGVLVVNILYDNNAGNIVRSANAFGAKEIILYGHKKFDRRASVGTEFYSRFRHLRYVEDLSLVFGEYDLVVAVENVKEAEPLGKFKWRKDKKTLLVFGQESGGIPPEILDHSHYKIQIEQIGSVRSLNVSVAAGIVMYDYCLKTGAFKRFRKP